MAVASSELAGPDLEGVRAPGGSRIERSSGGGIRGVTPGATLTVWSSGPGAGRDVTAAESPWTASAAGVARAGAGVSPFSACAHAMQNAATSGFRAPQRGQMLVQAW
jgi:hypothetical protein